MESKFTGNHFIDNQGNPHGGTTYGRGFAISWQHGPLQRGEERLEPNGAFVEDIIAAAIDRLEFFQQTKFNCEHNAVAIATLKAALSTLNARTTDREARNIEGTHEL